MKLRLSIGTPPLYAAPPSSDTARMPDLVTRLLCLSDLHLGRASGRLPAGLAVRAEDVSPRAAWRLVVAAARRLGVQAVVLAGDVVDTANDRFEAFGALYDGVRELDAEGIRVIAVAGNHDVESLPRLAALVPGFTLLGRGGRWASTVVDGPAGPVNLVGWSFPAARHAEDPTAGGLPARAPNGWTVGVLHGDLDARGGHYAPVSAASLRAARYDAWLLGHVHTPTLTPGTLPAGATSSLAPGYLGSLVGLDPTETGRRGAWLIEASSAGLALAHLALAPLRWERYDVDVTGLEDVEAELTDRILAALRDRVGDPEADWGEALAVGVRVRLTGRARGLDALARHARGDLVVGQSTSVAGRAVFIDDVALAVEPAHDLAALAVGDTPVALLARHLLAVEAGEARVLQAARARLAEVDAKLFASVASSPLTDGALRATLRQAGLRALDALLAQTEVRGGAA